MCSEVSGQKCYQSLFADYIFLIFKTATAIKKELWKVSMVLQIQKEIVIHYKQMEIQCCKFSILNNWTLLSKN